MTKTAKVRALLATGAVLLLTSAYYRTQAAPVITDAAKNFVASLTIEQRHRMMFDMTSDNRTQWFYTPVERKGLALREMNSAQRQLALAFLSAGLSQRGFIKATTIMSLDEILAMMEYNNSRFRRDPDGLTVSIFGEPSEKGAWAYRMETHHVSQNFTIVDGKVIGSPSFFGSNPAEIKDGPRKGLRILSQEEDLGRAVIHALTPEQRAVAIFAAKAPGDVVTTNSRKAAIAGNPSGVQISALDAKQKALLQDLLDEYCGNMTDELAQYREEQIKKAGDQIWFAWAGGLEHGEPSYYRVQSPTFLVEFDMTQDNANHVHAVWRDFNGDFGEDLLKEHYAAAH